MNDKKVGVLLKQAELLKRGSEKSFRFSALLDPDCSNEDVLDTMRELKEAVFYQGGKYGIPGDEARRISDGLIERCIRILMDRKVPMEQLQLSTDDLNRYFMAAVIALQQDDALDALRNLMIYESYSPVIFRAYPHLLYYKGLAYYGLKKYKEAKEAFAGYCESEPCDEIAHFYLGNVYCHLGDYGSALEEYGKSLELRSSFPEVLWNMAWIGKRLGDDTVERDFLAKGLLENQLSPEACLSEDPFACTLAIKDELEIWDIPVFINSYNRLGTLRKLIHWLLGAGYRKIYILDNDSTYKPLLDYYLSLSRTEAKVQVIYLRKNLGYKALWESGVLNSLQIESPYVYTDSDVVPGDECPGDFLASLLDILRRYPLLKKAGLGLKTDDITYFDAARTREMEKRFYLHRLEEDVYFSAVDTTMAVYRNYRHYNIYVSARTSGKLMAYHLPWYYDYDNLPEDERYYIEHANASASLVERIRKEDVS